MNSIQAFVAYLKSIYPAISAEAIQYLCSNIHSFELSPKSTIIELNSLQEALYFMHKGLAQAYYIDEKGNENNIRFVSANGWITHYSALLDNSPSKYTFESLEHSVLVSLPYKTIVEGYKMYADLEKLGRLIAENILIEQQKRIESFQFLSAEERYLQFLHSYPKLANRISISHLSSYLGIKRQSLTRIRKNLLS